MTQLAHNLSYLTVHTFTPSNNKLNHALIALPKGAEVLWVSLEVIEEFKGSVTAEVVFNDTSLTLMSSIDLTNKKINTSAINFKAKDNGSINLILSDESEKTGKLIIKAFYFLPSRVKVEY